MPSTFDPAAVSLALLPLLIFCARILDVSIGTLRILFVARSYKALAALLGFVEALVWILAIGQVMQNLSNWVTYVAFALGFAAGNYIGILIEERIALGSLIVRIITQQDTTRLQDDLRDQGYGVTSVAASGGSGNVKLLFTVVKRRHLQHVVATIKSVSPNAFYSIEDVRFVQQTAYHPLRTTTPVRV